MARKQLHDPSQMLDHARTVVLEGGSRGATIERIADAAGAPSGTIYHRFGSRDGVLVALWSRAVRNFQAGFLAAATRDGDPAEAAVAAALWTPEFATIHPADAGLLITVRRADLVGDSAEVDALNAPALRAVVRLARRIYGAGDDAVERVALAVVDLPYGAVRRHLPRGPIPPELTPRLERAVRAVLTS